MLEFSKILFISDALAVGASGAKTVTVNHLAILKEIYGSLNVSVINLPGTVVEKNVNYMSLNVSGNIFKRLYSIACGYTGRINEDITNIILEYIKKNNYNTVFIDSSTYGKLVKAIKMMFPSLLIISYYADVKANLCQEWMKKNFFKIPIYQNLIRNELITSKYCDINLVLNKREKKEFQKYYPNSVCDVLKIPVNRKHKIQYAPKYKKGLGTPLKILFLGVYYYPNVNGIDWFVKEVLSELNIPVQLQISGTGMEALISKYSNIKEITVTGRVDNLEGTYINSDIVIGPIFEGAGMKVKTAEAFSFGKCYIGTQESLEGYYEDLPNDLLKEYIHKADNKNDFVEAIVAVSKNKNLQRFNECVYDFFYDNYSLSAIGNELKRIIGEWNISKEKQA